MRKTKHRGIRGVAATSCSSDRYNLIRIPKLIARRKPAVQTTKKPLEQSNTTRTYDPQEKEKL